MYTIPEWRRLQNEEEASLRSYLFREDPEARTNAEMTLPDRLPKRRRKRPVICPITGKEAHSPTGIHKDILELALDGIKYRTWHQEHELVPVVFGREWLDAETIIGGKKSWQYVSSFDFLKKISLLVGQPVGRMYPKQVRELEDVVIVGTLLEHGDRDYEVIQMSRDQARALAEMIALFNKYTSSVTEDAEFRANHWLTAMASGQVSLEQIDGSK